MKYSPLEGQIKNDNLTTKGEYLFVFFYGKFFKIIFEKSEISQKIFL